MAQKKNGLTPAMKGDLAALAQPGHSIHNRSITNATLKALKRRGLATVSIHRRNDYLQEHWDITDAGRAALKPANGMTADKSQ